MVSFPQFHYNVIQRVCEAISGYFVVLARNSLAHTLDYILTQMKKLTVKRAILLKLLFKQTRKQLLRDLNTAMKHFSPAIQVLAYDEDDKLLLK